MSLLKSWLNEQYLDPNYINDLVETMKAKPEIKYLVLDNFFRKEKIDQLIEEHKKLEFSEKLDSITHDGEILPYDSAVNWMQPDNYGYELLFSREWFDYLSKLASYPVSNEYYTEVKLRYHKADAKGFWIHTDSAERNIVFICYFNKNWKVSDGGILQLWRIDECECEDTIVADGTMNYKMTYLNNSRLHTSNPGGGFSDGRSHDLILVDQILPIYNRVFISNLQANPTFHSVTPSADKERTGFVQWIYN